MDLLKSLDYGINGFWVPFIPRAKRSARKRVPIKKVRSNQICPSDLLASVADNIGLERECFPSSGSISTEKYQTSSVKTPGRNGKEDTGEDNEVKVEPYDQGKCIEGISTRDLLIQAENQKSESKQHPIQLNSKFGYSLSPTSDCLSNFGSQKLVVGNIPENMVHEAREIDATSLSYKESGHCKSDCGPKRLIKDELLRDGMTDYDTWSDMLPNIKQTRAPVTVENNLKMSLYTGQSPNTYTSSTDNIDVVSRDDDDNSSGCTHPITIAKSLRPASSIGHQRTKKLSSSRYRNESPALKNKPFCKNDEIGNYVCRSQNDSSDHQRSQKNYPFKKRKYLYCNSVSSSDGGISCESNSGGAPKGRKEDTSVSGPKIHGAGKSGKPSIAAQCRAFKSRNSQVKLSIKSFTVPELFIEIPETSTVGSLKRTVLEAVTSLFGGGVRVGVLVKGKKIKDDRKTIMQTRIPHVHKLDALDFTLEPSPTKTFQISVPGDSFTYYRAHPLARYSSPTSDTFCESHLANVGNDTASDHDSAPSPIGISTGRRTDDSSALVAVTATDDALAVRPVNQKGKRTESAQRRIRRPFSVVEVETLVQAVEKLGTGRWRDVKMQAFDDAEHRTYVDLKDKWKTLVHTARISPQQRRGEPVPQELLDRVLIAHAYWSQQ